MPIELADHSAAYKAYKNLARAPKNITPFTLDEHGQPKVRRREAVCRMPSKGGQVCRRCFASEARLWDHLTSAAHRIPVTHRPDLRKNNLSRKRADRLSNFYSKLMKNEDYEGKGRKSKGRARKSGTVASRTPTCTHDNEDEELEVVERPTREFIEIKSSPAPELSGIKGEARQEKSSRKTRSSMSGSVGQRSREETIDLVSDDDEEYLMAQLKAKRAKREFKEAMLEEAEFEQKLAARKKR